jgi:hypothetical protein
VYRIARFPYITAFPAVNDEIKWEACKYNPSELIFFFLPFTVLGGFTKLLRLWQRDMLTLFVFVLGEAQKEAYAMAGILWECPLQEVVVEHVHRKEGDGEGGIPVYVRVPKVEKKSHPVVVLMTGLDGYRPDNTVRCEEFLGRGW